MIDYMDKDKSTPQGNFQCAVCFIRNYGVHSLQGVPKVRGHFSIQINESFRIPMLMKVFHFYVHCFL